MFEIKAAVSDPCQTCRVIALITLSTFSAYIFQDAEGADFFSLRLQMEHVPPAVDFVMVVAFTMALWVVCERVVVGRMLGGCGAAKQGTGGAGPHSGVQGDPRGKAELRGT